MATVTSMSVNGVSNTDREVYVTFKWSKSHTDGFEIDWEYTTGQITKGDYRWYVDDWSTHEPQITQGRYTYRYTAPDNAIGVRCWVRPISTENSKGKKYWTASWSSGKTYYFTRKCPTPKVEGSMSADCKKVTLTGSEYSTDTYTEQFRLWWDRSVDGGEYKKWQDYRINLKSGWEPPTSSTIYDTSVTPGHTYKYRLSTTATKPSSHAFLNKWSDYSEEVELTTFPSKVNNLKAQAASSSSMTLTWDKIANAEEYIVEYTTNKDAWDQNAEGDISSDDGITATKYTVTGLETGQRWYCRVYATNDTGDGEKSDVVSVVVGTVPDAPTLYATETAYMRGEQVYLRWNHNSEDESEQTEAQLRWTDDNGLTWTTITLGSDMYYVLDTTDFDDASTICWQVCTKGVLATYSEWSGAERFMVYAQPSIVPGLFQTDENGNTVDELNNPLIAFPLYISIESESENQNPIAYDVSIKSRDTYLYVNNQGENAWMPAGTVVWSGHLDGELEKKVGFTVSAADAFLVPGVVYEVITIAFLPAVRRFTLMKDHFQLE